MAQHNPRYPQAHLLGLPRELRNEIYGYVFHETSISLNSRNVLNPPRHLGGLTLACKQLYCETYMSHFKNIEVTVNITSYLHTWLEKHKPHLCLLPVIKFGLLAGSRERRHSDLGDDLTTAKADFASYTEVCSYLGHIKAWAHAGHIGNAKKAVQIEVWNDATGTTGPRQKVWTATPENFRPAYEATISRLQKVYERLHRI